MRVFTHLKSGKPPLWYLHLEFNGNLVHTHLPDFDPLHKLAGKENPPLQEVTVEPLTRFERESVI